MNYRAEIQSELAMAYSVYRDGNFRGLAPEYMAMMPWVFIALQDEAELEYRATNWSDREKNR